LPFACEKKDMTDEIFLNTSASDAPKTMTSKEAVARSGTFYGKENILGQIGKNQRTLTQIVHKRAKKIFPDISINYYLSSIKLFSLPQGGHLII